MSDHVWDKLGLLPGPADVLIAPSSVAAPTKPKEAFLQKDPYTPVTGARWIGATAAPSVYARNFTEAGFQIQQANGDVFTQLSDTERTSRFNCANITKDNLGLLENSAPSADLASEANQSAYEEVPMLDVDELDHYWIAFVARFPKEAGEVIEPPGAGGKVRGRYYIVVLNDVVLAAENVEESIGKGDLVNAQITMKGAPDADGLWGHHWLEKAGTISTS
jgi:hypothetical protein